MTDLYEKHKPYLQSTYKLRVHMMNEYLGNKCVKCGAVEYLQVDPSSKSFNPKKRWGAKWEVIKKELDKCQLLCKTRHKIKSDTELTQRVPWNKGLKY